MSNLQAESHLSRARSAENPDRAMTEFMRAIDAVVRELKVSDRETADLTPAARTQEVLRKALRAA